MANHLEFELNRAGVRELMLSTQMMAICREKANSALSRLGDGYEATEHIGKNRVNVEIKAVSYKAQKENSQNNTILKSLGG